MKLWELVSVMREEQTVLKNALPSRQSEWHFIGEWIEQFDALVGAQDRAKLDYELPDPFVRSVLENSRLMYCLCGNGYLRSHRLFRNDTVLTALVAFERFGGEALEEALEKGSAKVL